MFFAATGFLGFLIGVVALALALSADGITVPTGGSTAICLLSGSVVSALGGGVASRAYRETRRRPR